MNIENTIFHADSLLVLERLPPASVQIVYLDPPWPTGREDENIGDYYLFLANRLQHIDRVLASDGNLFVHIQPHIIGKICILVEHLLEGSIFRNQFIVPTRYSRYYQSLTSTPDYTSIVLYGKTINSLYNAPSKPRSEEEIYRSYPDSDNHGRYRKVSPFFPKERSGLQYEWQGVVPPAGYSWKYSLERMNDLHHNDLLIISDSRRIVYRKEYLETNSIEAGSIWDDISALPQADERTGYSSQQGEHLLKRVIEIGSNPGDLVLDPFCGSGTTFVAAAETGRRWIGCDISEVACDIAAQRISGFVSTTKIQPVSLNSETQKMRYLPHHYYVNPASPEFKLWDSTNRDTAPKQKDFVKPLVLTEGKTDWKHLKIALAKLKDNGIVDRQVEVDFHEFDTENMGDTELLNMCKTYLKTPQIQRHIFVFDRDNKDIIPKVEDPIKKYKNCGNNVFSFAIPVPEHRLSTPKISIEFYYRDEDLKRLDGNGRRLFLSNEFNLESGWHLLDDLSCREIGKLKPDDVKIIDNKVFNREHVNVALPKNNFANYIYEGTEGFDEINFREFKAIFAIIEEIMQL